MLNLDEQALTARFWDIELSWTDANGNDVILTDAQRLVQNQPQTDVDETQPWVRFTISPGTSGQASNEQNPRFEQLGFAYVQVFAPKGTGMAAAREIRDQVVAAYRRWISIDYQTRTYRVSYDTSDHDDYAMILVKVAWESLRKG